MGEALTAPPPQAGRWWGGLGSHSGLLTPSPALPFSAPELPP